MATMKAQVDGNPITDTPLIDILKKVFENAALPTTLVVNLQDAKEITLSVRLVRTKDI